MPVIPKPYETCAGKRLLSDAEIHAILYPKTAEDKARKYTMPKELVKNIEQNAKGHLR